MSENLSTIIETLAKRFDGQTSEYAGETSLTLPTAKIAEAARVIHDEYDFNLLSAVTAVDYWPEENPRFHLIYRFTSVPNRQCLNVRIPVPASSPSAPTIETVYHNANWQEREVYDLFGIKFAG